MSVMTLLPKNDPRLIAWEAYKQTEEFANTKKWAAHAEHVQGKKPRNGKPKETCTAGTSTKGASEG